ncbi:hypothetical protein ANN_11802 [Periplaneta americana]|uniref:Uncharacterized protein n=1 Tax=Periplaneta americana TaxID=6978 RepID=A0ABQ8T626_PERAM|nr:hypothetical protein ANN_11802 [Periplaneta americana]
MALPVVMYGSEAWVLKEKEKSKIQAAEMSFLRAVKGCTREKYIRNEKIREEIKVQPFLQQIEEHRCNWVEHLGRLTEDRIPKMAMTYRPRGRRTIGRPKNAGLNRYDRMWSLLSLLLVLATVTAGNYPVLDVATTMRMLLVPVDTKVGSAIYRLRGTDSDFDYPLQFEFIGIGNSRRREQTCIQTLQYRVRSTCTEVVFTLREHELPTHGRADFTTAIVTLFDVVVVVIIIIIITIIIIIIIIIANEIDSRSFLIK